MGEAQRRKREQQHSVKRDQEQLQLLQGLDLDSVAEAVHRTVEALTLFSGADCILYAAIGAGLLSRLGVQAQAVAGTAAWRIGPGASDVLAHHPDVCEVLWAPAVEGPQGAFHAWIQVGEQTILDLSTRTLDVKAAQLDAADGGSTTVAWCPTYLLTSMEETTTLESVTNSYSAGTHHYQRRATVEARVLSIDMEPEHIDVARFTFDLLSRGESVHIVGPTPRENMARLVKMG